MSRDGKLVEPWRHEITSRHGTGLVRVERPEVPAGDRGDETREGGKCVANVASWVSELEPTRR